MAHRDAVSAVEQLALKTVQALLEICGMRMGGLGHVV